MPGAKMIPILRGQNWSQEHNYSARQEICNICGGENHYTKVCTTIQLKKVAREEQLEKGTNDKYDKL